MARKSTSRKTSAKKKTARKSARKRTSTVVERNGNVFSPRRSDNIFKLAPDVHVYGKNKDHVCTTNTRGYARPGDRSPLEIVLDASEGFIPLWSENVTLRWRFNEQSMMFFQDVSGAKDGIRQLFGEALLKWGDAAPVRFKETTDVWDFEIVMRRHDNCDSGGCVLASAFFPDAGRHELILYPVLFRQSQKEQVDTFIHEIGHVFGLRHFFANVSETAWPSVIFGRHEKFSIMNYGADSELTSNDKSDLRRLYEEVWSNRLKEINGTPIVTVRPYHELGQQIKERSDVTALAADGLRVTIPTRTLPEFARFSMR